MTYDAVEHRRRVKGIDDRKHVSDYSKDERLAEVVFRKQAVKAGSVSLVPGAILYRKNVVVDFRKQMAMSSSQGLFSACKVALERTGHPASTPYG